MRVLKVEYIEGYKLRITFSDKTKKIVDFEEKLKDAKGIFLPLKNLNYFKQVSVDDCNSSICWPNGADICPDLLYDMGRASTPPRSKRSTKSLKIHKRVRKKSLSRS